MGLEASLQSIFNKLRKFGRVNKVQFSDIRQEMKRANNRLDKAEERIDETETATSMLIKRLTQCQANLESQEGRDLPSDRELKIEQAHRALAPKPSGMQAKPQSIVVKFGSYWTKEGEHGRKNKLSVAMFAFTQTMTPPEVLKKHSEYAKAKKVPKEKCMEIFYDDGTQPFHDAAEATWDMASREFPATVVRSPAAPDQEEIWLLSTWQVAGTRCDRDGDQDLGAASNRNQPKKKHCSQFKEKLYEFRRETHTAAD